MPNDYADLFQGEAAQAASTPALNNASAIVEAMARMESEVSTLKRELESREKLLSDFKTRRVPDALDAVNQAGFTLASGVFEGVSVEVAPFVSGTLPKAPEARTEAMEWLTENDGADLIKSVLTIRFEKSQHSEALDLVGRLREEGYACEFASDVHPQSLLAYARERLKEGEDLATDVLGLFIGRVAKLKWPKGAK